MNQEDFDTAFNDVPYPWDCKRIQEVGRTLGISMTLKQAFQIWDSFSDSMAAGWINLPDDDAEIAREIESYVSARQNEA